MYIDDLLLTKKKIMIIITNVFKKTPFIQFIVKFYIEMTFEIHFLKIQGQDFLTSGPKYTTPQKMFLVG